MGNRVTWQQERRAETRVRLLEAAFRVFVRSSYAETAVNDILAEAGVGRTSFYKHFPDKLTLAEALFEDLMPDLSEAYAEIAICAPVDRRAIAKWLDGLVEQYVRNAGIMRILAQVQSIEPRFGRAVGKAQRAIMASLGSRFPLFARAAAAPEMHDGDYTRATLVIDMIDHLCSTLAIRQVPIDRMEAIGFLSEVLGEILSAENQA